MEQCCHRMDVLETTVVRALTEPNSVLQGALLAATTLTDLLSLRDASEVLE